MVSTIIVGFDGSTTARQAAAEAAHFARQCGAQLHVVNVVDDDRHRQGMHGDDTQNQAESDAASLNELLLADDILAGVEVQSHVLRGAPARRMIDLANELPADMIVVGNRRVQGIDRVLGSVAVDLLRKAPCGVYVANTT